MADLLVNREVSGEPTMTFLEAVEAGMVVPPALMRWQEWQKWRATEDGCRPMKGKGGPFTSSTTLEWKLWRQAMLYFHGATWEEDLKSIAREDLENLDGASVSGSALSSLLKLSGKASAARAAASPDSPKGRRFQAKPPLQAEGK